MYVIIGQTVYRQLLSIQFSPEISLLADTCPINFFEVQIKTTDTIPTNGRAALYGDDGTIFANFYITNVNRTSPDIVTVKAEDVMSFLDTVICRAQMIETELTFTQALATINVWVWADDRIPTITLGQYSDTDYIPVKGYLPQQTARERLLHICFAAGVCFTTCFSQYDITFRKWETGALTYINQNQIFWKPQKSDNPLITDINWNSYMFTITSEENIKAIDNYVQAGNEYWHMFTLEHELNVTHVHDLINRLEIVENYLISRERMPEIMTRVVFLNRIGAPEITAKILCDDYVYRPGDYIQFSTGYGNELVRGYIVNEDITFGKKIKINATIKIIGYDTGNVLTLRQRYAEAGASATLRTYKYLLPAGYQYRIPVGPVDDSKALGNRCIFYTATTEVTGTITQDTTVDVNYNLALSFDKNALEIYNVDAIYDVDGVIEIEDD